MSNSSTGTKPQEVETELCTDYSIGQRVFGYLENTIANNEEVTEFVEHAAECSFCMNTMVRWHYDSAIIEMTNKQRETNAAVARSNVAPEEEHVWDWSPDESGENKTSH